MRVLVRYAGKPEMEALLDQPMAAEDVSRIREKLQARGVNYQVTGDRVLVPADRKQEILSGLFYDQALPQNTAAAWDAMAHASPSVERIREKIREVGLRGTISWFEAGGMA